MFENLGHFFKRMVKTEQQKELGSKDAAKERLHLVLVQDRANVSADFLELMKQEIIDVIKKYIEVDDDLIDVRLTNQSNDDGTNGQPVLYANIPIIHIKNDMMAEKIKDFEGLDFNKEIGITPSVEQDKKQVEALEVIELPEKNKEDNDEEEVKEMFEEVDDDDDDVTFDDLLKAAEAEDKIIQENLEKDKNDKKSSKIKEEKVTKDKPKKKD